jgi:hypothetical protein
MRSDYVAGLGGHRDVLIVRKWYDFLAEVSAICVGQDSSFAVKVGGERVHHAFQYRSRWNR